MGYERFLDFLSTLYNSYKHKIMTFSDFTELISSFDNDGRVMSYLKAALNENGLPD
jgi:hypothetical protein